MYCIILCKPLIMLKSISVYKLNQMGYDLRSFRLRLTSRTLDQKLNERRQRYTHVYRTFSCHGSKKEVYRCEALVSFCKRNEYSVREREVGETTRKPNDRSPKSKTQNFMARVAWDAKIDRPI